MNTLVVNLTIYICTQYSKVILIVNDSLNGERIVVKNLSGNLQQLNT